MGARPRYVTEAINRFYSTNDRQLELLIVKMHRYACQGKAEFAKLLIDRIEGPVTQIIEHHGEISHIVSDADRRNAQEAVERIKRLQESVIDMTPEIPQLMDAPPDEIDRRNEQWEKEEDHA